MKYRLAWNDKCASYRIKKDFEMSWYPAIYLRLFLIIEPELRNSLRDLRLQMQLRGKYNQLASFFQKALHWQMEWVIYEQSYLIIYH